MDLAPFTAPPTESKSDLAPGPEQQQSEAIPKTQVAKPEETPQEKIEQPQPSPDADVQLPVEPNKPPDKQIEQPSPPALATSPPRPTPSAAQVSSWHRKIAQQVERHKGYPAAARARHETGVAQLAFKIDRQGMVVASRVVRTSGFASLDQRDHRYRPTRTTVSAAATEYARRHFRVHSSYQVQHSMSQETIRYAQIPS